MTTAEMEKVLSLITYNRPNRKMQTEYEFFDCAFIVRLSAYVQDATGKSPSTIEVSTASRLKTKDFDYPEQVIRFIRCMIVDFETHESLEWLKYQGTLVVDQHGVE